MELPINPSCISRHIVSPHLLHQKKTTSSLLLCCCNSRCGLTSIAFCFCSISSAKLPSLLAKKAFSATRQKLNSSHFSPSQCKCRMGKISMYDEVFRYSSFVHHFSFSFLSCESNFLSNLFLVFCLALNLFDHKVIKLFLEPNLTKALFEQKIS